MSTFSERMFDKPGPRAKRMILIWSVFLTSCGVAGLAIATWLFYQQGGFAASKWLVFVNPRAIAFIGAGVAKTLAASLTAGLFSLIGGLAICIVRVQQVPLLAKLAAGYTELARSIPSLLILYFTILILPHYGLRMPVFWQLVVTLSVTNSALIAEILRASVNSIPRGQLEAALVLGQTRIEALFNIVLPQALRAALPSLVAQVVFLLKSSAVGYVISYEELLYSSRIVGEFADNMLQSIFVVTVIYLAINSVISQIAFSLGRRETLGSLAGANVVKSNNGPA